MSEVDGARSFLVGYHADLVPEEIIGTNNIWTSVNRLTDTDLEHLHIGDPGREGNPIKSNVLFWKAKYPISGEYRLVKLSKKGLYNVDQLDEDSMFVCELQKLKTTQSAFQGKPKRRAFSKAWDIVKFFPTAQHWGCYDLLVNQTVLSCGFQCIQRSDCRSFYHEPPRGRCVLVLFVDML
ncbi:hypothetical protein PHET_11309, partial [Paragonimus heterotremus]